VDVEICTVSGQLPGPDCPHRVKERFIVGTEPTEVCQIHQRIGDEVYTVLPPEAQAWARDHNIPQPSQERSSVRSPATSPEPTLILTSPDVGATYRIDPTSPRDAQKIALVAETDAPLERVIFLANGASLGHLDAPPYTLFWQLEPGEYHFSAVGIGADGTHIRSDTVPIEVLDSQH
jgi:penicillin-binding protein 1C